MRRRPDEDATPAAGLGWSGPWRAAVAAGLAAAVLLLTGALALSGGPASHMSVLYLLPIAAAALVLGTRMGLVVLAASALCYGGLFVLDPPGEHGHGDHGALAGHIVGMWAATALVALVIATLIGRIGSTLRHREEMVRALEDRAERHARVVALSTLAAGAAHELGSPLATIAIAAKELERGAASGLDGEALARDARLIRAQVTRCRAILDQMGASAGGPAGESPERVPASEIVRDALDALPAGLRGRIDVAGATSWAVLAPRSSVARALANLVQNALEASAPDARVRVEVEEARERVRLRVRDQGEGMAPDVLARAGEPFFSTKAPGRGQGLGLFLARAVAEQLGGALLLESVAGGGTTATLELRAESAAAARPE